MADDLVSMKRSKKDLKGDKSDEPVPVGESDPYPYGLEIRLHDDEISKLGIKIKDYSVGDEVMIVARGSITEIRAEESMRGTETRQSETMEIQITDMKVQDPKSYDESFKEASEDS